MKRLIFAAKRSNRPRAFGGFCTFVTVVSLFYAISCWSSEGSSSSVPDPDSEAAAEGDDLVKSFSVADIGLAQEDLLRQINELNASDKADFAAINILDDASAHVKAAAPPTESMFAAVEQAAQSRAPNEETFLNALREVEHTFFSPTPIYASMLTLGIQSQSQSESSRVLNLVQTQISETNQDFDINWRKTGPVNVFDAASTTVRVLPVTQEELKAIREKFGRDRFIALQQKMLAIIDAGQAKIAADRITIRQSIVNDRKQLQVLGQEAEKRRTDINGLAIELGLPLFCSTVLALFIIPFILLLWNRKSNGAIAQSNLPGGFEFSTLVEVATVLLLTMSILILGLATKLTGPVLGTLLGGISGYVLNRVRPTSVNDGKSPGVVPGGPVGSITGILSYGGNPLKDLEISIAGTAISAKSNALGRYVLSNVQPGAAEVIARKDGKVLSSATVVVSQGSTVECDLVSNSA